MEKVTFTFNDHTIEAIKGQTVLQAVTDAGYEIPHYCYHPGLPPEGSCRLCAVETGKIDKDGQVSMSPKLEMSCKINVTEGQIVRTDTEKVRNHQKAVMEFLLINHPLDCPVCDQAGECELQDYSYRYGNSTGRYVEDKVKQAKKDISKNIILFSDRCIKCTRCVRFLRTISGGAELAVIHRGYKNEIDVFPGRGVNNKMAGNIVDICPVGAMTDRQFRFKQRVWLLSETESICPRCSRGCSITIDHNEGIIYRLRPRFNPQVNGYWMCDDGRYGFKYVQADERLKACKVGRGDSAKTVSADGISGEISRALQPYFTDETAGKLAVVVSPFASYEEQKLLVEYVRVNHDDVILVAGPVFSEKEDEVFKNGFTISAEKVPNRRGFEAIMKYAGGNHMAFDKMIKAVAEGSIEAVWFQGYYPWPDVCDDKTVKILAKAKLLVVEDILESSLARQADILIAAAAWTEKQGSTINDQDIVQSFEKAIDPPAGVVNSAELLWQLTERSGDFNIDDIRETMKC